MTGLLNVLTTGVDVSRIVAGISSEVTAAHDGPALFLYDYTGAVPTHDNRVTLDTLANAEGKAFTFMVDGEVDVDLALEIVADGVETIEGYGVAPVKLQRQGDRITLLAVNETGLKRWMVVESNLRPMVHVDARDGTGTPSTYAVPDYIAEVWADGSQGSMVIQLPEIESAWRPQPLTVGRVDGMTGAEVTVNPVPGETVTGRALEGIKVPSPGMVRFTPLDRTGIGEANRWWPEL